MHTLFSQKTLLPLLGLGLAGLLLTPHSASAFGYTPTTPPDLIVTNGTATVDGTGTAVTGDYTFANGSDTTTTNFVNAVETDNASSIVFNGGGSMKYVTTKDNSSATLAGGSFDRIGAAGNSTITISGGTFNDLYTFDNGTINLIGTNLKATPNPFGFVFSRLTGTLSDGTTVFGNYRIEQSNGGRLQFNGVTVLGNNPAPVPEASSVVSLGLMLALGAGGFMIARRKKAGAAA